MSDGVKKIRVLALGVLRRSDGKLLLDKGHDSVKGLSFYRPLGGGVEFGEVGEVALKREFMEETGRAITVDKFLGTAENIFVYEGQPGHQIIFLYACRFANDVDEKSETIPRIDGDNPPSLWRSLDEINAEGALLYPAQILDFI